MDWWAYGVLLYELMAGYPPFFDSDVTNTYKKILGGRFTFPPHFSISSRDLIRKLLVVSSIDCQLIDFFAGLQIQMLHICAVGIVTNISNIPTRARACLPDISIDMTVSFRQRHSGLLRE